MTDTATAAAKPENAPNPQAIPPDELARLTDDIVTALRAANDAASDDDDLAVTFHE